MSRIYYHGGAPGLKIGEYILPPDETDAATCADYGADKVCRRDRVYLTTDFNAAAMYAAFHPSNRGSLYEVQPIGDLEPDPDCTMTGLSYATTRAKILRVFLMNERIKESIRKAVMFGI